VRWVAMIAYRSWHENCPGLASTWAPGLASTWVEEERRHPCTRSGIDLGGQRRKGTHPPGQVSTLVGGGNGMSLDCLLQES
jgi:hypothetical protein